MPSAAGFSRDPRKSCNAWIRRLCVSGSFGRAPAAHLVFRKQGGLNLRPAPLRALLSQQLGSLPAAQERRA